MQNQENQIKQNYAIVSESIAKVTEACGRKADDVKLVVVSKLQPLEVVQAAIGAGIRRFGENYPEEGVSKISAFSGIAGLEWHMIGHIQSRKAGIVAKNYHIIHSLDSYHLASKLERSLAEENKNITAFLEVNVSGEESKQGFQAWNEESWQTLAETIKPVLQLEHLQIQGLMTMPPFFEDAELSRPYFQKLARLRNYLLDVFPDNDWFELSMGTSQDYKVAIQEGATYVRIGQAILGERIKKR